METVGHKRPKPEFKSKFGKKIAWLGVTLGAAALVIVFGQVLAKAEIKIVTAKSSWIYNDAIRVEKSVSLDAEASLIPAQVFSQGDTVKLAYPATGTKNVQRKAAGKIVVYNAYDSKPQTLVATTRFVTPDGKIFRLVKTITVPGASVSGGKIIPSSIETDVVADKAGVEYNIGPVSYFSIPGFKESGSLDKFQGFYGESKNPMTGGFIGEVAFPTDGDIKSAKANVSQTVSEILRKKVIEQIPKNFSVIDGAAGFSIVKQEVNDVVDGNGNFAINVEAQITIIAFNEQDLLKIMENKIEKEKNGDYIINDFEIKYGQARADFANGRISFPINFTASISKFVDTNLVRKRVKGKSEPELRAAVNQLIDLQSAEISLWPFWVKRVPNEDKKISIIVE
ncbi:MAG: hypothetical protein HYT03_03590 [Candidatus Harrisonbacteria bacterium]|nr:hypothetical protein [Candidatus Harrisonbacteria bacterium]